MIPGITASRQQAAQEQPVPDPYWENVVLLMRFNGDFSDEKGAVMTPTGDLSLTSGRFGQALRLAATGTSGVAEAAARPETNLPGAFTVEGWVKPTAGGAFLNRFAQENGYGWQIEITGAGKLNFYEYAGSGRYIIRDAGADLRDGLWHHVAAVRRIGYLTLYVDGVQIAQTPCDLNYTSTVARFSIGYQVQGGARYPMRGDIDEVRVTKGVGRYTTDFAPPAVPFPNF